MPKLQPTIPFGVYEFPNMAVMVRPEAAVAVFTTIDDRTGTSTALARLNVVRGKDLVLKGSLGLLGVHYESRCRRIRS